MCERAGKPSFEQLTELHQGLETLAVGTRKACFAPANSQVYVTATEDAITFSFRDLGPQKAKKFSRKTLYQKEIPKER